MVNDLKVSYLQQEELDNISDFQTTREVMANNDTTTNKKVVITKGKLLDQITKKLVNLSPGSRKELIQKLGEKS